MNMENFYNECVTAAYHHGSRLVLNSSWKDRDVICPNSKIYYVLKGEICVELENESIIARSGDIFLIPAGVKHSYHLTELTFAEKYWFHFDLRCGQENYFDFVKLRYCKNIGVNKRICELFDKVIYTKDDSPSERLGVLSALTSIVSICLENCERLDKKPDEDDLVEKTVAYIKENYRENLSLNFLADMAKLSPNYFIKIFKERLGYSPVKYVNVLRVERAKFLLEHTDKPIGDVMEEVGFWDAAHFSKLFKYETGYSPSKFRKALTSRYD